MSSPRSVDEPLEHLPHVEKRNNRPYTYTDIYLAFQVPAPTGDTYKMQALSSNLISGYEVFSVASDTFFKHASNDSSASIETTLIYKKTGNMTVSLENIGSMLGSLYCTFKMLPLPLIQDMYTTEWISASPTNGVAVHLDCCSI